MKGTKVSPIFTLDDKHLPVYMRVGNFQVNSPIGSINLNNMTVVIQDIKKKRLIVSGRLRCDNTGEKTVYQLKQTLPLKDFKKAIEIAKENFTHFNEPEGDITTTPLGTEKELVFGLNPKFETIMKKMEESDMFNIGKVPQEPTINPIGFKV